MANGLFGMSWGDLGAVAGFVTGALGYGMARFHKMAREDAKTIVSEEYSKLTLAINNLNTAVLKLNLQFDQTLAKQHEQSKSIENHDDRLDNHELRLTKLEEHNRKGD